MTNKYSFRLRSHDSRRQLPGKLIIGRQDTETENHVLLKLLAYVLFFRERLQVDAGLRNDNVPYRPDVIALDYEMRPRLWIECGDPSVQKLDRLAVKVPEAEIWIMRRSLGEAEHLFRAMAKGRLRRARYHLIGLDELMVAEMAGRMAPRNEMLWVEGGFQPPELRFDFNGFWFEAAFHVLEF